MEINYFLGTRHILLAIFGVLFSCASYLIYEYEPSELIVSKVTEFSPNSYLFNLWKEPPIDVLVKIYIFNVTNPEEFLNGKEKIRLQEVGPYTYRENLYNINNTFNENGTLTFIPKRRLEFSLKDSIGNASIDRFIMPNIALLGLTSYLQESSMFTKIAFSSLTSYLDSQPFVNITVDEYLMGYDDMLIKMANTAVPNWIDFSRLGILDRVMALDNSSELVTINIKHESDYNVLTHEQDIKTYAIERWANSPGLAYYGYVDDEEDESYTQNSKCNSVEGAFLGIIFPQNVKTNKHIRLFRRAFCRPIPFSYRNSALSKDGFEVDIYTTDSRFLLRAENNSENECYCQKTNPDDCPPNGIGDVSACYYGIPVAISLPHFLNTDPSVLDKIDGLHPEEDKHEAIISVHSKLGIPIEAHIRAQINLIIPETQYNSKTRPFNNLILPLFWVDLSVEEIPSEIKLCIRLLYYILPIGEQVLMYILAIVGVLLLCISSFVTMMILTKYVDCVDFKFKYTPVPLITSKHKHFECDMLT